MPVDAYSVFVTALQFPYLLKVKIALALHGLRLSAADTPDMAKVSLKTLSSYWRTEPGVIFGQNVINLGNGVISVGDKVKVW